ncbi:hypothetical protein [Gracilinema caldarium]|uniref:hypothetical protein n=1 Tax=Gracilinema caldarium TaxID=215591 RepID=UPI0026EE291B|nr:hypothetical protein [Gracilinema caldarium]
MEERKKRLVELKKKLESHEKQLVKLFICLGQEALSKGAVQGSPFRDELAEYSRLDREERELRGTLEKLESLLTKERALKSKHKELSQRIRSDEKDLTIQQVALGVSVLTCTEVPEVIFPLKQQYEALIHQLEETEDHLSLLEQEEPKDFFSFIGNQSRKLVLKTGRAGKEREIKKVSQKAGETLLQSSLGDYALQEEAANLMNLAAATLKAVTSGRTELEALSQALDGLQRDFQQLGVEGNPLRSKKNLEKGLKKVQDELENLFEITGKKFSEPEAENGSIDPVVQSMIDEIQLVKKDLLSIARQIEILTTELEIAKMQHEIGKLKEKIKQHELRQERERRCITDAQHRIDELSIKIQSLQHVLD